MRRTGRKRTPVQGRAPGLESHASGKGLDQKHPQLVVPFCVSTVFGKTLSEAELRGLEGAVA